MKNIALITNTENDPGFAVTARFEKCLGAFDCRCFRLPLGGKIPQETDLAIVFGGDGSIMRVSHSAATAVVPVLGVNLGKVGYLAELEPDEEALLCAYFNGDYTVEERMMIDVTDTDENTYTALNDVVVSIGGLSHMVTLALECDGEAVSEYYGNGLVIATPTGSTAYSLSAGGPIISPKISCMAVTPICSHSLSARPMIFDDCSTLTVKNVSRNNIEALLNVDGNDILSVPSGTSVTVKRSTLSTSLIRIKREGFYTVLGRKMKK